MKQQPEAAVKLYQYQKDYLRGMPAKAIFAADTGTGKTFMALAHYDKHAYLTPLLILAPASKISTGDWERDVEKYFAGRLKPEIEYYSYEKYSRIPTLKQWHKNHYDGVAKDYLARHPSGFAIIADEVHKAKNPQSGIGKRLFEASKSARFFVGLSATPLPNGWIDVANYFKLFGLTKNITEFKSRYVIEQKYKGYPEIIGYNHEQELQSHWNRIARPLNKQTALDLPPITSVPVKLEAGKEYTRIRKDRIFGGLLLDNPSALLHALRRSIVEPKVVWLENFLDEVSSNTVVFYSYKEELSQIKAMLKKSYPKRQIFEQNGDKHEVPSKDSWSGLHRTITLAQYQSGSTGVEMTYADVVVYFSPTYSYSNYEQSLGRIYRNGQKNKCTFYLLCAPSTIESDVWGALRNKTDFQSKIWYANLQLQSNEEGNK